MRLLLIFLLAAFAGAGATAQTISGTVKDVNGTPVTGATVTLLTTASKVIKMSATANGGTYSFPEIAAGTYRVSASYVGFTAAQSADFSVASGNVSVPEIRITKAKGDLAGVTVTSKKPVVEVKADKTILNVEGTINATGSDALDLLRKSPGVTVDKDENLSLSGKNGVQVYVDGRPSPLAGQDLANYLKSIPSSNIEAIELITNPSAKYEAAGNAGIINIRLKKNKSFGTNGSVNAGYNIGILPKYNGGFSLNHRNATVNLFGNYSYNAGTNRNAISIDRNLLDTAFNNNGRINMKMSAHNFKAGADFFLNKKSTLGVIVNGNIATPILSNTGVTAISYKPTQTVDRLLVVDNKSKMTRENVNFNLNYTYNDPKGTSLSVNGDYGYYKLTNDQYQPNYYYDATGANKISSTIYRMIAPTDIDIYSMKADYEQNLKGGKLGLGGKIAFINTANDFRRYNVGAGGEVLDKDRSNQFAYSENINAAYINYNRPFKGFLVQGGLRMENTTSNGTSTGLKNGLSGYKPYDSSFRRSYTDVFPSAAITFNKNPKSQFSLTYSRRIDRPNYQDLNPFEFKLDEYTFQKGNINLRPQYTNSFGMTHTYRFKLNTSLNYSIVKDMWIQLIDTAEGSKAFISKRNLATQNIASLNVSYPFMYKAYTLFTNVSANYSHYRSHFGGGNRDIDLNAVAFSIYAQNSYKFAKTWTAELTGFYNAPTILMGSMKAKAMGSVDMGLQKSLFETRATLKASVSDVFKTLKFNGTANFAGQKTETTARWESRQFKL
ncbi:MAG: TonB-dependent receptor, partial [Flaviaesturariibacter sp.]|nr:TonB-dependent receptor [Flaviaesturariibacter sp.]